MATNTLTVVLFDGFELLDVFGPVELLSMLPDDFAITFVGPTAGAVASSQGVTVNVDHSYQDAPPADILLLPGGAGSRVMVRDAAVLAWLSQYAADCDLVTSVCTGSAVLAAAGLLDGYRATSNKMAFRWVAEFGTSVTWVPRARWVHDRDRWTSSGVAAGMDMTAALISHLCGPEKAQLAADIVELDVQADPSTDRFADLYGL